MKHKSIVLWTGQPEGVKEQQGFSHTSNLRDDTSQRTHCIANIKSLPPKFYRSKSTRICALPHFWQSTDNTKGRKNLGRQKTNCHVLCLCWYWWCCYCRGHSFQGWESLMRVRHPRMFQSRRKIDFSSTTPASANNFWVDGPHILQLFFAFSLCCLRSKVSIDCWG